MTIAITIGRWGGLYVHHRQFIWRLCLGFAAIDLWPCEYDARLGTLLDAWDAAREESEDE